MRCFPSIDFAGRFEGSRNDRLLPGYDTPTGPTCRYTTSLDVTSLTARIRTITARLAAPVGGKAGTGKQAARGYASKAERHAKTVRLQTLTYRLAAVEADLAAGAVHVVRGGKALLHKRNNLADAGLTAQQWRQRWDAERLFLTVGISALLAA